MRRSRLATLLLVYDGTDQHIGIGTYQLEEETIATPNACRTGGSRFGVDLLSDPFSNHGMVPLDVRWQPHYGRTTTVHCLFSAGDLSIPIRLGIGSTHQVSHYPRPQSNDGADDPTGAAGCGRFSTAPRCSSQKSSRVEALQLKTHHGPIPRVCNKFTKEWHHQYMEVHEVWRPAFIAQLDHKERIPEGHTGGKMHRKKHARRKASICKLWSK